MCLSTSQIFAFIGIIFEVIGILYTAYSSSSLFAKNKKENYMERNSRMYPISQELKRENKSILISISLVAIGVIFQALAIFFS
jgi:hypothetical protein